MRKKYINQLNQLNKNEDVQLISIRKMAELFDLRNENNEPATETILQWWHSGKIPPPDVRLSRKAIYWKGQTIQVFINNGGHYA